MKNASRSTQRHSLTVRARRSAASRQADSRPPRAPRARKKEVRSSIVIPVFNQAALTAQCLAALIGRARGRIVIVDDGSSDTTPQVLAGYGEKIRVITHGENAGFARSCNDGAETETGEFLVFLNNDTLPEPGWLEALEGYADEHPSAAVVGARLLYPDRTIQHAGVVICQDGYPRHIYSGFPGHHPAVSRSREFQIVTGACMLVRRQVFEAMGGFDTVFRNGFEDVDFCLRLRERGWGVHYCAESVLYHLESVSPGRFKGARENVELYRQRWAGRVRPDDVDYYAADGLLRFEYEGRYPVSLSVSPLLATVDDQRRSEERERLLRERSREVADLQRENTRLSVALGAYGETAPEMLYRRLRERIRETARSLLPAGATVLVISKGDGLLLDLPGCRGWHFPQAERGAYAGHHPATSAEAILQLEALRAKGGEYLLIPATSRWWLNHYAEFRQHLETCASLLGGSEDTCVIFGLNQAGQANPKHVVTQNPS